VSQDEIVDLNAFADGVNEDEIEVMGDEHGPQAVGHRNTGIVLVTVGILDMINRKMNMDVGIGIDPGMLKGAIALAQDMQITGVMNSWIRGGTT